MKKMKKLITGIVLSGMLVVASSPVATGAHTHSWTLNGIPYTKTIASYTHRVSEWIRVTNKVYCKESICKVTEKNFSS